MKNTGVTTRLPSHPGQPLDWKDPHWDPSMFPGLYGAHASFTYVFPVSKYVEAYALGPNYISYLSYNHGNQPYASYESGLHSAASTPKLPNFMSLSKVSPKSTAAGIQAAQLQIGQMLANRSIPGNLGGF